MRILREKKLFTACEEHDLNTVRAAIESGHFDINVRDEFGRSLLLAALSIDISEHEHQESLPSYLLDKCIDCNGTSHIEDRLIEGSVLHLALLNNYKKIFLRLLLNPMLNKNAIADDDTSSEGCFAVLIPVKLSLSGQQYHVRRFSQAYFLEHATILHYACLLGHADLVEAVLLSGANPSSHANLVLNKHLIGATMLIQERDNPDIDLDLNSEEGYEDLGVGWAAREPWPVTRTRRVTALHLAARMGHVHVIRIFQQHGIPMDAIDGEKYSILNYAKFGLEEFKDNYEYQLRGDFSSEPVNENSALAQTLSQQRLNDIDRDINCLVLTHGHPEAKISHYHDLINYLVSINEMDQVTASFGTISMMQSTAATADNEIEKMLQVETRYFDFSRSQSIQTSQLKTSFFNNRYGTSKQSVSIKNVPARRLITADSAAVCDSILHSGGAQNLTSEQAILTNLQWPYTPNAFGASYSWQNLSHGNATIKYIHKPVVGHLGGFFMPIKPKENDYAAIMQIISVLTQNNPLSEHLLARCMIIFSNTGSPMPRSALRRLGLGLDDTQYELLLKICYLTSVKEMTRRMHTGLRSDGSEVRKLPFAMIHARALILIREGHLRMTQVFSQDADYGIASGYNITGSNIGSTLQKARNINRMYHDKIEKISRNSWPKQYRQELQSMYGGECDSDGEGYEALHRAGL